MKRILVAITLCISVSSSAPAAVVLEFSPGTGGWTYDGAGTLTIHPTVLIDKGLGSVLDALVVNEATITLPSTFTVTGWGTGGPYSLIPVDAGFFSIEANGTTYFKGYLGEGDLVPVSDTSTLAGGYTSPQMDIASYQITDSGLLLGSDALAAIAAYGSVVLDFDIVFSGAEVGFRNMLENNLEGQDNFSGSISIIPEPATMTILGLGGLVLLRKRKQHKTGR